MFLFDRFKGEIYAQQVGRETKYKLIFLALREPTNPIHVKRQQNVDNLSFA
jgi:hypothetical protein